MAQIHFEPQLNASAFIIECGSMCRCGFFFIIIIRLCIHRWVLIFGHSVKQQVLINAQRYPLCVNNSLSFMASVWFGWNSTNYSLSQYNTRFQTHSATFKANYAKVFAFCVNEWIKNSFLAREKKTVPTTATRDAKRVWEQTKIVVYVLISFLFYLTFLGLFNAVRTVFLLCFENAVFVHILWSVGEKWAKLC